MPAGPVPPLGPCPLGTLLDAVVGATPERVALRIDDRAITYRDLAETIEGVTATLTAAGVSSGSRVGLCAGNSELFVATAFSCWRLGAAVVMVSTSWRDLEVDHACELVPLTHLVHDDTASADLGRLADRTVLLHISALTGTGTGGPAAIVGVDELAVFVFSSGTTGLPKAVRHTHRTMWHAVQHWTEALGLGADDRLQIATPPFHILGLLNFVTVLAAGASVRLHRRFDLDAVLHAIEDDRITIEMAVAPIAIAMANHPSLESFDLSSLRYIMWGATPVTASVAETVTRRSGVGFLPAYGASELPVISANPIDRPGDWRLDSVGVPPTGVEVRVADLETGALLPAGMPGELQVRSDSMMLGYLPEAANAETIVDGWYRTGDIGTIDADGWITITDRVKELVKVNGFQVAPAEVESVLFGHPAVADCAVFGVPDDATGEAVVAAVVSAPGAEITQDQLIEYAAERLARYKRVRRVVFLERLPRLPSGKVLRRELADMERTRGGRETDD